jgi:hypothetical protein
MNPQQMRDVFALCKEFGVRSIQTTDLKVTFETIDSPMPLGSLPGATQMPTEEEFLFAAVDHYDPQGNKEVPVIQSKSKE